MWVWLLAVVIHTALWLLEILVPTALLTWLGALSSVAWYWLILGALVSTAALTYLTGVYGRRFGIIDLPTACVIAFGELHGGEIAELAQGFGQNPQERLEVMAGGFNREKEGR